MSKIKPFDPLDYDNLAESVISALIAEKPVGMPIKENFTGAGVYALYYLGDFDIYRPISKKKSKTPIYVGKAIQAGGRTGQINDEQESSKSLFIRLNQHARSIQNASNIVIEDFRCRFLVMKDVWIGLTEQLLIRKYQPIWNVVLDGFGNHPPGSGRKDMIRPRWDMMHPGRCWAARLKAEHKETEIRNAVKSHFEKLGLY